MSDSGRNVLLAIGGGIAAYKSAILCSRLAQGGYNVRVMMTSSATEFIGPPTLAALSSYPVATDSFVPNQFPLGAHIELTRGVDLMIVAPCTANLMAKFAAGIADDLVTTSYLQADCPVLCAPAMSAIMWDKPSVQRNLKTLQADGVHTVGPDTGWLSCRDQGAGRMSEPDTILEAAKNLVANAR